MPQSYSWRHPLFVRAAVGLLLLALLAVPSIVHSMAAINSLRNVPVDWLPDSVPTKQAFKEFVRLFKVTDLVMITWPGASLLGEETSDEQLERVANLLRPLAEQEPTEGARQAVEQPEWAEDFHREVRALTGTQKPLAWVRSGSEMVRLLIATPSNLPGRVARKRLSGTLIGPDGEASCIVVSLGPSTFLHHDKLLAMVRRAIARATQQPESAISLVGGPVDGAAVDTESIRSINRYSVPSSLLAAVLCYVCIRSWRMVLTIVVIALIGQGLVLALVYYSGQPMNALLIVLPPLVFVLTVSAGIHLSNYYLDILREQPDGDRIDSALAAVRRGLVPCLIATGTTLAGLISLTLVHFEPVRLFGIAASVGVALTLLLLLLVLPAAMVFTPPPKKQTAAHRLSFSAPLFAWLGRVVVRHRRVVILAFLLLGAFSLAGLQRITTTVSVPAMFAPSSDLRKQYDQFERRIGATATGDLLINYPAGEDQAGEAADPLGRLAQIARIHKGLLGIDGVGGVLSAATYVPPVPRSGGLAAIATRGRVRAQITDSDSSLHKLGYLIDEQDKQTWRITVRLFQADTSDFAERLQQIRDTAQTVLAAEDAAGTPPTVKLTGHVAVVQESQQLLLDGLADCFFSALGIILIIMVATLRSLLGGVLTMLPNVLPAAALFGAMGWLGVPLDIGSIMTASVALGIAIDDTAHLLSRYAASRRDGLSQQDSATTALNQCGPAMMYTTLVCGLSLLVYAHSSFMPTQRFAWFMFGMLVIALVGVSVLLPALMCSRAGRYLAKSDSA